MWPPGPSHPMCAARPVLHLPRRVLHVPTPPPPPQHPRPVRHPAAPTVNRPGRPTASPGAWSISAISPGGIFKKTVAYQADIVISGRVSVILALIYQPKRLIRHSLIYHRYIKLIAWWCVIRTTHSHRPTPHGGCHMHGDGPSYHSHDSNQRCTGQN